MEFHLIYKGQLNSNRGPVQKQIIRRQIHTQLKDLVSRPPMGTFRAMLEKNSGRVVQSQLGEFTFVPIISESLRHTAELNITLLVRDEPGRAITRGGDLDNRIKTLLDGLRKPHNLGEIPEKDSPNENEQPFFCLLEDDALVSRLNIYPDRLLQLNDAFQGVGNSDSDVIAIINVFSRPTYTTIGEVQWVD
ncbi:hypothetical protein Q9292_09070 [Methylophilus sp. VKM B-3414]|uniref:hypothetical protein n=1 Tax=Methylophilus sp. VKM B-3414 TaxID=3076121 RepID=UPI0028C689D7|nr:hypothetical protein [Methylophilus sp. VKM B-3414]MDT7849760.1 hypothetical protein [Methylophilus sp. VKM B-3414]